MEFGKFSRSVRGSGLLEAFTYDNRYRFFMLDYYRNRIEWGRCDDDGDGRLCRLWWPARRYLVPSRPKKIIASSNDQFITLTYIKNSILQLIFDSIRWNSRNSTAFFNDNHKIILKSNVASRNTIKNVTSYWVYCVIYRKHVALIEH